MTTANPSVTAPTVRQAVEAIASGELSPVDLALASTDLIQATDSSLNHFITWDREQVVRDAAAAFATPGPASKSKTARSHGIPLSFKDVIKTAGIRTTAASKVLKDYVPDADATVVAILKRAGFVVLGKTNAQEFAMGNTGAISYYGPARNPWNLDHITGGSSSGSAGSVAARTSIASIGTDTGGSIRIPAALCGVVGFKPTYGRVSRSGVIPLAWTMDCVGPLTHTAEDAAFLFSIMADSASHPSLMDAITDVETTLNFSIRGTRIAVIREFDAMPSSDAVRALVSGALDELMRLGCKVQSISMPSLKLAGIVHPIISMCEAVAAHGALYRANRSAFGYEAQDRLDMAHLLAPSDYLLAQRLRTRLATEVKEALNGVDILISPSCPYEAPEFALVNSPGTGRRSTLARLSQFTRPFSQAGVPAVSVPCGFGRSNLPIGMQIVGRHNEDMRVLRVAHQYQLITGWHTSRPPALR